MRYYMLLSLLILLVACGNGAMTTVAPAVAIQPPPIAPVTPTVVGSPAHPALPIMYFVDSPH